jgi:hypothetical protein
LPHGKSLGDFSQKLGVVCDGGDVFPIHVLGEEAVGAGGAKWVEGGVVLAAWGAMKAASAASFVLVMTVSDSASGHNGSRLVCGVDAHTWGTSAVPVSHGCRKEGLCS